MALVISSNLHKLQAKRSASGVAEFFSTNAEAIPRLDAGRDARPILLHRRKPAKRAPETPTGSRKT